MRSRALQLRAVVLVAGVGHLLPSSAATHQQIMASKYLRTQFCIERAVGQRWHERFDIPMRMTRWGISEPTLEGLSKGPAALRKADERCRRENEIDQEPRPPL